MRLFLYLLGHFQENVLIISLKAPGNYSASFWCNKISVLSCEGPRAQNSMISGFLDPWEPVFMDVNIPKYFKRYKKSYGRIFEKCYFYKYHKFGDPFFTFWENVGTKNHKNPFNEISKTSNAHKHILMSFSQYGLRDHQCGCKGWESVWKGGGRKFD